PVYGGWDAREAGKRAERRWTKLFKSYRAQFPDDAAEFERRTRGDLPADFETRLQALIAEFNAKGETIATRKASQNVLDALVPALPELGGGSADLTGSNLTMAKASKATGRDGDGNYVFYGVREFGMCAVMNGLALHGGVIPYGGTFLVFSDYARNALRLAALMGVHVIYVFSHDSLGLGEDGPTHQPIEHAATLRLMPNMEVWRPCDTVETAAAWAAALRRKTGPTALLLTRQNVPFVKRATLENIDKGGYVLADAPEPKAAIIATGSEIALGVAAQKLLADVGIRPPERGIPELDPAAATPKGSGGSGRHGLLAQVRRARGCRGRYRPLRRVGAGGGRVQALWFHPGERSEGCEEHIAMIKVAINGFGRIGRMVLRAHYEGGKKHGLQFVAVNDLGDAATNAHLLKYDTAHGAFPANVRVDGDSIVVNNDRIKVVAERDPAKLPWRSLGVDIVLECTGLFTSKAKAGAHLQAGARKVIISAPGEKDVDRTVVYGVNHKTLKDSDSVISNASCTTNCLAPLVKAIDDRIGVASGLMNTIHSFTNDQVLTDVYHKDLRRARAAG